MAKRKARRLPIGASYSLLTARPESKTSGRVVGGGRNWACENWKSHKLLQIMNVTFGFDLDAMNLAMDSGPSSSWQYQQQAIDAEIKSLEESLRALRQRRNTLSPISSLPAEVIAAIFLLARLPDERGRPDIRVAHVCRRWREIVLDHPVFWSHVNITAIGPAGVTEMLARAKMAPLYLEATIPPIYETYRWEDAGFVAFQKVLQAHISHIYRLRISVGSSQESNLQRTLEGLISPAPTLEHLSLSVKGWEEPPLRVSVPDTLFDSTTPKLSFLELSNCDISWKSPLLKGLKHLETIRLFEIVRPNLTDWLDTLDEMPQLKKLLIHSASPSAAFVPFSHAERTVTLPSLVHLDISAPWYDCTLALAHLVLPSLTSLHVTASSGQPTARKLRKLLQYVAQHAHGPQDTEPLQSMTIDSKRRRLDILAWSAFNINDAETDATLSERLALSVTCTDPNLNVLDDFVRILDAAMTALPLDNLVTFTSGGSTRIGPDAEFWRLHEPRWPLLKHLHLGRLPARRLREMLLQDNGGLERPLFPSLTRLELIYCALSARRTQRLCDVLMNRVEQGVPLEVLDLRSCPATSLAVQLLSEIVVDVWAPEGLKLQATEGRMDLTWDGARGPFARDDDFVLDDNDSRRELYWDDVIC
jgi:hypothetical protein